MKQLFLLIALAFALVGCQAGSVSTDIQKIETACVASSAAIKVLTEADRADKLSAAQEEQVLHAISLINPICTPPDPQTLDSVKQQAFLDAVALLEARAAKVKP